MQTLAEIPREVIATDTSSLLDFAVSHVHGDRDTFVDTVRDATWHAERDERDFAPHIDALQAISLTLCGDWTLGAGCARRSIPALDGEWWSDPVGRFAWNTAARGSRSPRRGTTRTASCWTPRSR